MFCEVCNQTLFEGMRVIRVSPVSVIRPGGKSGLLGIYSAENHTEDIFLHYPDCAARYMTPSVSEPMFDYELEQLRERVGENLLEEVFAKMRELAIAHLKTSAHKDCLPCWNNINEETWWQAFKKEKKP